MAMASSWRDSIYQWLSKATESAESPRAQDADHLPPVNPIKHFDSIPADLETLNAAQDPTTGKRTRGEDREEAMEQHGPKKTRNEYERRPRYKTREDRYDYKPNGPHSKEQSRKGKAKRLRRGRKETMNDGFHASNVARERLTLRKNTNVGIFNKGKASSPIKNRDVPDLGFSEAHFLSRTDPRNQIESITIDVNELKERGQEGRAPYNFTPPRAGRPAGTPWMVPKDKPRQNRDKADSIQHMLQRPGTPGPDPRHELEEAQSVTQQLQCQAGAAKLGTRSATPYSWSESEPSRTRLERAVDLRLLEILHTGISSMHKSDAEDWKNSQRKYCDLQELKALLNDRKAYWQAEDMSSHSGWPKKKTLEESTADGTGAGLLPTLTAEVISSSEPGLLLNQSSAEIDSQRHQDCHNYDRTVPIPSSYQDEQFSQSQDDKIMTTAAVEDDESFFRKLDEAFHEIMSPVCKEIQPTGSGPSGRAKPLHRESGASLLSDQLGFEGPYLGPGSIICDPTEMLATRPDGHHEHRKLPNVPSNERHRGRSVDDRYLTRSKQPQSVSIKPVAHEAGIIPQGFWRQNKLY